VPQGALLTAAHSCVSARAVAKCIALEANRTDWGGVLCVAIGRDYSRTMCTVRDGGLRPFALTPAGRGALVRQLGYEVPPTPMKRLLKAGTWDDLLEALSLATRELRRRLPSEPGTSVALLQAPTVAENHLTPPPLGLAQWEKIGTGAGPPPPQTSKL